MEVNTPVVAADLLGAVSEMERLIEEASAKRTIAAAAKLCAQSRELHFLVWWWAPKEEYAEKNVLPLLRKAMSLADEIAAGNLPQEEAKKASIYSRNIGLRINNIQNNFLQHKDSDFIPDSKLQDYFPDVDKPFTARRGKK